MNSIAAYKSNLTYKIKNVMPALLPNKHSMLVEKLLDRRQKQAIPLILSGLVSLGGVIIHI